MKTAGILLASGASRRFGRENKLLADLGGRPLVDHAAGALRLFSPELLVAVTQDADVARVLKGYDVVAPAVSDPGQSDSLRAGVTRAQSLGADRVLIVLGDMPFVDVSLLGEVEALCTEDRPSAATDGSRPMPPACFPKRHLPSLMNLEGDRGAAKLLRNLPAEALVAAPEAALQDIDTQEHLRSARDGGR